MPKTNIFESARIVISKYSVIKPHLAFRESSESFIVLTISRGKTLFIQMTFHFIQLFQ